jgi:hypothetical protein
MYKDPKSQAIEMFNHIRFTSSENPNCTTCDCTIKPILKYIINQIIKVNPSGWINNGFDWENKFITNQYEGWVDAELYWKAVYEEINNL